MNKELKEAIDLLVSTPLRRSNATDYLVSILIGHLIKEGIVDAEKLKQDLIQQKNNLLENKSDEELKTDKEMLSSVIDACIGDIDGIKNS